MSPRFCGSSGRSSERLCEPQGGTDCWSRLGGCSTCSPWFRSSARSSAPGVSLLHIGFTLLLSWNPSLVLVTMPAHSATNLAAVRLMKQRSVILMETVVVVVGAIAFAVGLLAWQR